MKSKEVYYLYLKQYEVRPYYSNNKVTIYSFGRIENALKDMISWRKDFTTFPHELKKNGCTKKELDLWIETLETGTHTRTGKKFSLVM